jgi:hypothetical protein
MQIESEMSDTNAIMSSKSAFGYRVIGILVLGLLFFPMSSLVMHSASATTALPDPDETDFVLAVTPSAPNLPADRNSYYAAVQLLVSDNQDPIEAPRDMEIIVISSDPTVISLPSSKVTLAQGESMTKVQIVTTDKAGVATITAQSVGVKSSTTSITTLRMDSLEPTRLAIYAAPSVFLPDPQRQGMIYIQVLNSQGLPAVSKNDISVDISSSDQTVGRLTSYSVIPAGSSGILVDFIPQKKVGQTIIKASAPGLAPGERLVTVNGPIASKLLLEFAPNVIPAVNYYDAQMSVSLINDEDEPVRASSTLRILLKSSDTSILEVPQYVEIPAGKSFATTTVVSKGKLGTATITASATGYETGINSIDAVQLSTAGASDPKRLNVFSVPSVLLPDNSEHKSIVIAFQDEEGRPYRQTGYLYQRIALSTSNTLIGELTAGAFLSKDTYAIAGFKTKYAIGETTITASLEGYSPAQMSLFVEGSGPFAVALTQIPAIIEANNFESQSLVASLVDQKGLLVPAQEDTLVYLSSSDPEITKVQASIIIPAGETHATASAQPSLRPGTTTISGAANGLGTGSTSYKTVGFIGSLSEYHLGLYTVPKLPADGKEYDAVVVQLQDQNGLPVLAKSDVIVSLSSGSLYAGTIQDTVTVPAGLSQVSAKFKTTTIKDDGFKITASSEGFASVEAEIETTTQPLTILKSSIFPSRFEYGVAIPISLDVFSGAIPVSGASVTITGASAEEHVVMTDAMGHAEGQYIPTLPGINSIIVKIHKPGYQEEVLTSRITLEQTINLTIKAETLNGQTAPVQLKVNPPTGVKTLQSKAGVPMVYSDAKWGQYTVSAPPQVKTSSAVYDFSHWSDGSAENPRSWQVVEDSQIVAIYSAQYLLQIQDSSGFATGGGYYSEGEVATISMSQTTIPGIFVDKEFAGWKGAISSTSQSAEVVIDGPKTIEVQWSDSYIKVAVIAAAIGGGGFFYYWKIFKPKKEMEQKTRAPDLDWYKS